MAYANLIALSGSPGGGKTAVAEKLVDLGHAVVPESAREFIARRNADGLSSRPSPEQFAQALIEMDFEKYERAEQSRVYTFFDRTVLDSLSMLGQQGRLSIEKRSRVLAQHRFNHTAFFFPPWEEIYCKDSERDQSFEEAVEVYQVLERWYLGCGYKILRVPEGAVDERCSYILQNLTE